jgi:hypothetical protein
MLDISSFLKAQKVMWVKRLTSPDEASWKAVPKFFFESQLGLDIFKCNMICDKKPEDFPDFYWQIIQAWFETKNLIELEATPINIRKESLWLNKNIKYNDKVLFWKDWHDNGVNMIHDITKENGSLLNFNEFQQKYGIPCNFLKYNRLKDCIPNEWRTVLKTQNIADGDLSFDDPIFLKIEKTLKSLALVSNKDIYWMHVRKKQQQPIIKDKLEGMLGIKEEEWTTIFLIPKTVRNTKIRTFQYKILFNLIPCNLYLKRIQKSDTDKCDQCGELDDLLHYLYECNQNAVFWSRFSNWWQDITDVNIQLDRKTIMVGCTEDTEGALNACILIAKWHIYKSKLNSEQIFFYKFLCELKYALVIEKNIALRNNTLAKYNVLWQKIEEYIT